jgi:hypothetical protein
MGLSLNSSSNTLRRFPASYILPNLIKLSTPVSIPLYISAILYSYHNSLYSTLFAKFLIFFTYYYSIVVKYKIFSS